MIDYNPRDNIIQKMEVIDKENSKTPTFQVEHSFFDFSDIIMRKKIDSILQGDFSPQQLNFT